MKDEEGHVTASANMSERSRELAQVMGAKEEFYQVKENENLILG